MTALSGLAAARPVTWIASALTDEDAEVAERGPYSDGGLTVRFVVHDREEFDRYYNVFANPTLWFIHHYLWGLASEPSVDRNVRLAWDAGYVPVNQGFADAVVAELERAEGELPLVMLQDYHLFVAPASIRERVPEVVMQHFTHIPWPMADYWRVLPPDIRTTIHESLLACDVVGLHTARYVGNFLTCVEQFTDARVDMESRTVHHNGRTIRVRDYPISVDPAEFDRLRESDAVLAEREALQAWRPERIVLRVDRTDPSKNVVRGIQAFELFLAEHPGVGGAGDAPGQARSLAAGHPRVRRVPGRDPARRPDGERPLLRHRRLAAGRAAHLRQLHRGGRGLRRVRRAARERHLRRDEPGRQGGAARERPRRRADPVRERGRPSRAGAVRAHGQPVRPAGAGRRHPRRADNARRRAPHAASRGCGRRCASTTSATG